MTYQHTPQPMPPVFLELPEGASPEGALVTGTYLNGGLATADTDRLTVPMPVQPGDPARRTRRNITLQVSFIVLAVTAGGLLSAAEDIPRPAEGVGNWAELAAIYAFVLALILGALPKFLGRKHRKALRTWIAGVEEASGLRVMLVQLEGIEDGRVRAEVVELGESLTQSRDAIMTASRDRHGTYPGEGALLEALGALARYAHNPAPAEQERARAAVLTFADRADNYVHTGDPDTTLGDLKV